RARTGPHPGGGPRRARPAGPRSPRSPGRRAGRSPGWRPPRASWLLSRARGRCLLLVSVACDVRRRHLFGRALGQEPQERTVGRENERRPGVERGTVGFERLEELVERRIGRMSVVGDARGLCLAIPNDPGRFGLGLGDRPGTLEIGGTPDRARLPLAFCSRRRGHPLPFPTALL